MERDVKYVTRYKVTVLIHMHEPHSSGVRRITRFVRVEVVVFILSIKRILQVVDFFVQDFCHDSKIAYFVQVFTLIILVT